MRLAADRSGVSATEFALLAPILFMMICGLCDTLHQAWAQATLDGAMQKAGRDSTIQGSASQTSRIDGKVQAAASLVIKGGTYTFSRKAYRSFADIKPENFTDGNGNGQRDTGECFDDVNGNGIWDADPSRSGQGGAGDVTLYVVNVSFPRLFPLARLIGASEDQVLTARTLLKNQPYAAQAGSGSTTICT